MKVLFVRMPYWCFWRKPAGYPLSIGLLVAYLRDRVDNIEMDIADFEVMDEFIQLSPGCRGGLALLKNYFVSEYSRLVMCQQYWQSLHTGNTSVWKDVCQEILKQSPDIIAIQCCTVNMTSVKFVCDLLKQKKPDCKIVLGGPHIVLRAGETMKAIESVDYCIADNAPDALHQIVLIEKSKAYKRLRETAGIWYRKNGQSLPSEGKAPPVDLDSLPFADRLLGDPARYESVPQYVISSQGCAWKCAYCSAHKISQGKVYFRSIENMIQELAQLKSQGFKHFWIVDDTFTFSKKRVREFVERVISSGLSDLSFAFGARVDTIDPELLDIVSSLNISCVTLGVESGSDHILKKVMHKKIQTQNAVDAFSLLRQYRFQAMGFFMVGNPEETAEEMNASYRLASKLDLASMNTYIATPLPETEYEGHAKRKGLVFNIDNYYTLSSTSPFAFNLSNASFDEVITAFKRFQRLSVQRLTRIRLKKWVKLFFNNPLLAVILVKRKLNKQTVR